MLTAKIVMKDSEALCHGLRKKIAVAIFAWSSTVESHDKETV